MIEFEHLKTAWKTWRKCPKLFEYLFVNSNPPSDAVELQFGRIFHEFAEKFHGRVDAMSLLGCNTAIETLEVFKSQTVNQPVVKAWVENFKLFETARWMYCKQNFTEPLTYWKPLAVERTIRLEGLGTVHVDRIQYYDKQSLMNCEYKSGKTFDIRDLRSELALYNIAVNKYGGFSLPCLWIGAYNPQLNVAFVERIMQRTVSAVWRNIQLFRTSVTKREFLYKPSFFCRWCPRLQLCIDEKVFDMEVNEYDRKNIES